MPPWHANPEYGEFKNDCRLSQAEKDLLRTWVDNGSPEGDPSDLPEPPEFLARIQCPGAYAAGDAWRGAGHALRGCDRALPL